jgi:hypothetical protein
MLNRFLDSRRMDQRLADQLRPSVLVYFAVSPIANAAPNEQFVEDCLPADDLTGLDDAAETW